jgi:hypothetical protein
MDAAMEHSAIAPAGFHSCGLVSFENDNAKRPVPPPPAQFPCDGAAHDTGADDTDVIRIHRLGPFCPRHGCKDRGFAESGCLV